MAKATTEQLADAIKDLNTLGFEEDLVIGKNDKETIKEIKIMKVKITGLAETLLLPHR